MLVQIVSKKYDWVAITPIVLHYTCKVRNCISNMDFIHVACLTPGITSFIDRSLVSTSSFTIEDHFRDRILLGLFPLLHAEVDVRNCTCCSDEDEHGPNDIAAAGCVSSSLLFTRNQLHFKAAIPTDAQEGLVEPFHPILGELMPIPSEGKLCGLPDSCRRDVLSKLSLKHKDATKGCLFKISQNLVLVALPS